MSYTPGMPTIDITLPPGTTQSTLDGGSKDTVYTETKIAIDDPNDVNDYTTPLVDGKETGEIKGRGNYTWTLAKKPYQIKLDGSKDVLGMGAAKTWILLANHADASLMRNKVAYDLAADLGLHGSPASRWVDLRINGQYRGNYLLTEKVEVKKNRVELANDSGVLAELDRRGTARRPGTPPRTTGSTASTSSSTFTLKDAKSGVPDPDDGESMNDAEFAADEGRLGRHEGDAQQARRRSCTPPPPTGPRSRRSSTSSRSSSTTSSSSSRRTPRSSSSSVFFYKDGPGTKLFAGPVWDFDSALANYDKSEPYGADYNSEYVKNAKALRGDKYKNGWMTQLFRNTQFVEKANQLWKSGIAYHVSQLPSKITGYQATVTASAANNFKKWTDPGQADPARRGRGQDLRHDVRR